MRKITAVCWCDQDGDSILIYHIEVPEDIVGDLEKPLSILGFDKQNEIKKAVAQQRMIDRGDDVLDIDDLYIEFAFDGHIDVLFDWR